MCSVADPKIVGDHLLFALDPTNKYLDRCSSINTLCYNYGIKDGKRSKREWNVLIAGGLLDAYYVSLLWCKQSVFHFQIQSSILPSIPFYTSRDQMFCAHFLTNIMYDAKHVVNVERTLSLLSYNSATDVQNPILHTSSIMSMCLDNLSDWDMFYGTPVGDDNDTIWYNIWFIMTQDNHFHSENLKIFYRNINLMFNHEKIARYILKHHCKLAYRYNNFMINHKSCKSINSRNVKTDKLTDWAMIQRYISVNSDGRQDNVRALATLLYFKIYVWCDKLNLRKDLKRDINKTLLHNKILKLYKQMWIKFAQKEIETQKITTQEFLDKNMSQFGASLNKKDYPFAVPNKKTIIANNTYLQKCNKSIYTYEMRFQDLYPNYFYIAPISARRKKKLNKDDLIAIVAKDSYNGHYISLDAIYFDKSFNLHPCGVCSHKHAKYVCKRCKNAYYCTKKCQKIAWNTLNHSKACFPWID